MNCDGCANPCCDKEMLCVPLTSAQGKVYEQLVQQTGGVVGNLCLQNFDPVFQDMARAVVTRTKISCEYGIPTPSNGQAIDPGRINVSHTPASGTKTTIPNIPEGAAGCDASGGWHFDIPRSVRPRLHLGRSGAQQRRGDAGPPTPSGAPNCRTASRAVPRDMGRVTFVQCASVAELHPSS